jgi:hypothetical protein
MVHWHREKIVTHEGFVAWKKGPLKRIQYAKTHKENILNTADTQWTTAQWQDLLEQAPFNRLTQITDKREIVRRLPFLIVKPLVDAGWWEKTLDLVGLPAGVR